MLIDAVNELIYAQGLKPQLLTATAQGVSNDFADGEVSTNMHVDIGSITTANVTSLVVQCEESTDGTTFTLIPGMILTVTATTTAANLQQTVRGLRTQRYVRANAITFSVTTTTAAFPVNALIFSQRRFMPVTASGTDRYPSA